MASQVSFSEEDFSCSVCHDIFKHPVLLSCGHSFCQLCLQQWWRRRQAKQQCPVCKATNMSVPPPCNMALKNLCETFREKKRQGTESHSDDSVVPTPQDGTVHWKTDTAEDSDSSTSSSATSISSSSSSSSSTSDSSSEDEYLSISAEGNRRYRHGHIIYWHTRHSVDARKRILDQSDITSSPHFHSENTAMPQIQDGQLSLGSQSFYEAAKLCESGSATVYMACTDGDNRDMSDCNVLLKVDSCGVPWDFYAVSRLRDRQPGDPQAPPLPDIDCFLFRDGCVTVYKLPPQHTLEHGSMHQEEDDDDEEDCDGVLPQLVACVLKLTRRLHASHLLQAQPHSHMHFCVNRVTKVVDCLLPVDMASSLDLLSQQEVTSARQVPYALPYMARGLIRPSDSPYQVDLVIVAETVNTMLTRKHQMDLIQDQRGWTVNGLDPYDPRSGTWDTMFRMLLNPDGQKSSVAVLSEALDLMASAGIEI